MWNIFDEVNMNVIETIIRDVITTIYPSFVSGIIFAVLIMFTFNYANEKGFKNIVSEWIERFKRDKYYRFKFYCAFYIFVVLCKTILCRPYHVSPLSNVIGEWGLYTEDGKINVDPFENFILFIPLTILLFESVPKRFFRTRRLNIFDVVLKSMIVSFGVSLSIELLQAFFKLGTFQISDLVFNTSGGILGGILYFIYNIKLKRKKKQ